MDAFHEQINAGSIQKAYKALLGYMMDLRVRFKNRCPSYAISGLYQGYMDMTYFAVVPESFKHRNLKIAIVFNYQAFRFEAWLAGTNRQVQRKYWELFKDGRWTEYRNLQKASIRSLNAIWPRASTCATAITWLRALKKMQARSLTTWSNTFPLMKRRQKAEHAILYRRNRFI
jgi:hypothetical protein